MTEVFFRGQGAWFINDSGGDRLAADYRAKDVTSFDKWLNPETWIYTGGYDWPLISGIFKIRKEDELPYQYTEDSSIIHTLLPSHESGSAFVKMVEEGKLQDESAKYCYFLISESILKRDSAVENPSTGNVRIKLTSVETPYFLKAIPKIQTSDKTATNHPNRSDQLMFANQASEKFWASADAEEKDTWPDSDRIEEWFATRGFSPTLAKRAATIIRPGWACSGRR